MAGEPGKYVVAQLKAGPTTNSKVSDFATSLQLLITQHLETNAKDLSQSTTLAMTTLLDAIHMLQHQVDALGKGMNESNLQPIPEKQSSQRQQFITLHRVFCKKADHCHNQVVYQDKPTYDNSYGWGFGEILKGSIPIFNMGTYLSQQPEVHFIVFKEHTCGIRLPGTTQESAPELRNKAFISCRGERMWIVSKHLQGVVGEIAQFDPYNKYPLLDNAKEMDAPYNFFFHHYQEFYNLAGSTQSYRETCTPVLSFLDQRYATEYVEAKSMFSQGRVSALHVEKLFRPNIVVVGDNTKIGESDFLNREGSRRLTEAVVSRSWPITISSPETELNSTHTDRDAGSSAIQERLTWKWIISSWGYKFDGQFFRHERQVEIVLQVKSSAEQVDIRKLNVYPLEYAEPDLKEVLANRGQTFWNCRSRRLVEYEDKLQGGRERYMIDMPMYQNLHTKSPHSKRSEPAIDELKYQIMELEDMDADEPPTAPHIYLFPNTVPGFNLRQKKWVYLDVDQIHKVRWNKISFQRLVLDNSTKDLVQALVTNRFERERAADLIENKGKGLIILLHGPPGTGKTLTAESVAELAEKPLYQVTYGDIGTNPSDVEAYLESLLILCRSWDCVVLLDEADFFFEQRAASDMKRNALVSVFLRVLEYFEGVLILTSNRPGTVDEAFKSRIQVAIQYKSLTKSQRQKIWKNFLSMFEDHEIDNIDSHDIRNHIDELAEFEMNGREIRNAITTARQLAMWRQERIGYHHLKETIEESGKFNKYLSVVYGGVSSDEIARESGYR